MSFRTCKEMGILIEKVFFSRESDFVGSFSELMNKFCVKRKDFDLKTWI